jgi:hypothetical protein
MLLVPFNLPLCSIKCFKYHPTKPEVMKNNICEGTDRLTGMTSLQVMVALATSLGWGSNEAVTLLYLVPWASILTCRVKTRVLKCYDSHHRPEFPLT